jgi:Sigma-70, region 4
MLGWHGFRWRCAMSAALVILPMVWATVAQPEIHAVVEVVAPVTPVVTSPGMAFYRKYTEGMLRRYVRLSMEAGRAPSLLGREMFRGKVTSYRVHGFDDVVIFVHDVETCLAKLDQGQQYLIKRIALQEYTQQETAGVMGLCLKTVARRYARALDELTEIFLKRKLLDPQKACQGVGSGR